MEIVTKEFDNMATKDGIKIPAEQHEAILKLGFLEFYRTSIPGGVRVVLAKQITGIINGGKKSLFLVNAMPPKDTLTPGTELLDGMMLLLPKTGEKLTGTYGMCNGRKFLCIEEHKPARVKKSA